MNYFQGDIGKLTDAELDALARELEDSGVLSDDQYDFDPSTYEFQAHEQWHRLHQEKERRHEARDPEYAAAKRRQREIFEPLDDCLRRYITPEAVDAIFGTSPIFEKMIRKG